MFFIDDCMEYTQYKSDTSIRIGLTNLLKNEIIARGRNDSLYFINPMVAFNGNRITFAKTYVKTEVKRKWSTSKSNLYGLGWEWRYRNKKAFR